MVVARGRVAALAALAVGLFFLTSCGSRINKDSYAAIKYDMTMSEVEKILGPSGKSLTKEELDALPEFQKKPKGRGMGGGPGGEEAPKEKGEDPTWYLWGDTKKHILVAFRKDDGGALKVLAWTASDGL